VDLSREQKLDDVVLNFINDNKSYSVLKDKITPNEEFSVPFIEKTSEQSLKRNYLFNKFKDILKLNIKDHISINKLEKNIIETFTFLKNNNLLPNLCPPKINFRFLRDTYSEQIQHYKEQSKDKNTVDSIYDKYADSKLSDPEVNKEPIINISTEYVRNAVKLNEGLKGKFLKSLRKNFSDVKNGKELILEITILHELGHFISTQLSRDSIISRSHRIEDQEFIGLGIEDNHMQNISRNILEGFSDCFALYLTQKHHPKINFIDSYAKSRVETLTQKTSSVALYNVSKSFHRIQNIKNENIDLIVKEIFNIAVDNALELTNNKINNDPIFKQELESIFDLYSKEPKIGKELNKTLFENIEILLRKIPVSNTINANLQKFRNNSLNDNGNNLTPK
jgi:hypothetical protein